MLIEQKFNQPLRKICQQLSLIVPSFPTVGTTPGATVGMSELTEIIPMCQARIPSIEV